MGLLKRPSAFLPLVMTLAVAVAGVREAVLYGPQTDEGTAAHLFQLLMPAQVPIIAFFAITWLPRAPRPAFVVLTLQLGLAFALFVAVFVAERTGRI